MFNFATFVRYLAICGFCGCRILLISDGLRESLSLHLQHWWLSRPPWWGLLLYRLPWPQSYAAVQRVRKRESPTQEVIDLLMESWTCSNLVGTLPEPCVFRRSFPATNGVRAKTLAEICPTNSDKIVRAELDRLSHRRHFHKTSAVLWHCRCLDYWRARGQGSRTFAHCPNCHFAYLMELMRAPTETEQRLRERRRAVLRQAAVHFLLGVLLLQLLLCIVAVLIRLVDSDEELVDIMPFWSPVLPGESKRSFFQAFRYHKTTYYFASVVFCLAMTGLGVIIYYTAKLCAKCCARRGRGDGHQCDFDCCDVYCDTCCCCSQRSPLGSEG